MGDQFLGEIRMVGFNFAPNGWALCQGQSMSISQNAALFSLLGTQFGGDGVQTFKLPDLQGRAPIGQGNGLSLPPVVMGEKGGQPTVTILASNMPTHSHLVVPPVSNVAATSSSPVSGFPAVAAGTVSGGNRGEAVTVTGYAAAAVSGQTAGAYTTGFTGNSLPLNIQSPYLCVNFIIALAGIFPSRG
jgi:microcystin-dependent protein